MRIRKISEEYNKYGKSINHIVNANIMYMKMGGVPICPDLSRFVPIWRD